MEHRLGQVGSVVMGFLEGRMESLLEETSEEGTTSELSGNEGSGVSGNDQDDQVSGRIGLVTGALAEVMREDSPMPPTLSHMRITSWIFETITNILAPEPGWKNRRLERDKIR